MNIKIRKLTPDLAEDYVRFFDTTPHDDLVDEHKCYCVPWCTDDSSGDYEARHLSSAQKRRDRAIWNIESNGIQGYLAYCENKVVTSRTDLGFLPVSSSKSPVQLLI